MDYLTEFGPIVGQENILAGEIDCLGYARDMSVHEGAPEAVIFATTTEQVSEIMKIAHANEIPVTVRGGGTSVTGAVLPAKGGILLNLCRMNNIKDINKADGYAVVEPGVICDVLNRALAPSHFFPPDPGSAPIATLGGMVATNASGVRAVKYGTTKDYVMAVEAVMADGRVVRAGTKARKSSAGYDLPHLFAATEGTLGVLTEITFKILPNPEYLAFAKLSFPTIVEAGAAVEEIFSSGIPVSTCEVLDGVSIDVMKDKMGLEVPDDVTCLLFMEIDGNKSAVQEHIARVNKICREKGSVGQEWSDDPARRATVWAARHGLVTTLSRVKPGYRQIPVVEDFGVPMTRIPETIADIQAIGKKYGNDIATFGHIGDGNLHAVVLMDVRKGEEWETTRKIAQDFIDLTLKYEGTLTAEHGVGMAKSPFIGRELGEGLKVMGAIKKALDPKNILNPGKMGFEDAITDIYDRMAFQPLREGTPEGLSLGPEVDNEILACIQCGFCTLGCPTYATRQIETQNARGRISLAYYLLSGRLEPSAEMAERLYECTLCLNCKFTCPAAVDVTKILQAARTRVYESGKNPEGFALAYQSITDNGNPFMEDRAKRTDVFPAEPRPVEGAEVLYWTGCVSSYQDLKIAPSLMKIMDHAGVNYGSLGGDETCCGYLLYITGAMDRFKELMAANVDNFKAKGVKKIVSTCSGCHKTFGDLYPHYSEGGGMPPAVHAVQYLLELVKEGRIKFDPEAKPIRVAYHDPCDIGRHMGIYEEPRELIQAIPGVELVEFPQNRQLAKCCGGGGGMKGFNLDLSLDLAAKRVMAARDLGAEAIVSACPSCKQNFVQGSAKLKKAGELNKKLPALDITELIAKRLAK